MLSDLPVPACHVTTALAVLGGKWKLPIIARLTTYDTLHFSRLQKLLPGVTQKMLTHQLRDLQEAGLVARRIYAEVPPRVEYRLTSHGQTLQPVIHALADWGQLHVQATGAVVTMPVGAPLPAPA